MRPSLETSDGRGCPSGFGVGELAGDLQAGEVAFLELAELSRDRRLVGYAGAAVGLRGRNLERDTDCAEPRDEHLRPPGSPDRNQRWEWFSNMAAPSRPCTRITAKRMSP